jgi:hypothetical protein
LFWEHESVINAPTLISNYFRSACQNDQWNKSNKKLSVRVCQSIKQICL